MKLFSKTRKYVAAVLTGALFFTGTASTLAAETFDGGSAGGFACVENSGAGVITKGDNSYLNLSPAVEGIDAVAAYETEVKDGVTTELSYDFKINQLMTNDNRIARITQGTTEFLCISTKDANLVYRGDLVIYRNLTVNRWYTLKITFTPTSGTYDVYLNGERIVKKQAAPTLATNIPAVLTLSAKYAPGFAIDNFDAGHMQKVTDLTLTGDTALSLLNGAAGEKSFALTAYDQQGNTVAAEKLNCIYTVYPTAGATAQATADGVRVLFSESAAAGEYTLGVSCGEAARSVKITLKRYSAAASSITLEGDRVVTYSQGGGHYSYAAHVFDQEGNPMEDEAVIFSLEGDVPDGIAIDEHTGTLTVSAELPKDRQITLRAELSENPGISAVRTVVMQDSSTYANDKIRFATLLDYLDNVKLYGTNPNKDVPLIANALDSYTMTPAVWQEYENVSFVPTDLASQGYYYSTLDALYALTGDESYRDEVDSVYQYYLDYFLADNGMPQWGGHRCLDLDTHTVHYGYGAHHELKGHTPYFTPFFRLDYDKAYTIGVGCWDVSVTDWDDFVFNRHGSYIKTVTDEQLRQYGKNYKYEYKTYSPRPSTNLTFRAACNDILNANAELYAQTHDDVFKNSAMKLLNTYWNSSSDLRINTYQFSTAGAWGAKDFAGTWNIWDVDRWWLANPMPTSYTTTNAGDRFYNQCADSLVEQGFVTEDERWLVREPYLVNEDTEFNDNAFIDWGLAKAFGEDSEEGQILIDRCIVGGGNYLKYAYDLETGKRKNILIDGRDLTGFVRDRAGYYGNAGTIFVQGTFTTESFMGLCYAYGNAVKYRNNPKYTEHIDLMWTVIQDYMDRANMGNPGTKPGGSDMELNLQYDGEDPKILIAMLYLYRATGHTDFLDMARNIASTIIEESMVNGFFVENDTLRYIPLDNISGIYAYALVMLEATIECADDLIPEYVPRAGVLDFNYYDTETGETKRQANETSVWYGKTYEGILPKEIAFDKESITLKVGETVTVGYKILPDDAANKSFVVVTDKPECVLTSWDSAKITGLKPGTATVKFVALGDNLVQNTFTVTVTE